MQGRAKTATLLALGDLPLSSQHVELFVECRLWLLLLSCRLGTLRRPLKCLDRKCNSFSLCVCTQHLHLDDLARLHCLRRIFDESVRELADVNQSILMHSDVDEGAELRNVSDDALQNHLRMNICK